MTEQRDRPTDWLLLGLFIFLGVLLGNDRGVVSEPLSTSIRSVLFPVYSLLDTSLTRISDVVSGLSQGPALHARVRELEAKAEQAETLRIRLSELERENQRLRSLFEALPTLPEGSVVAEVVAIFPDQMTGILSAGRRHEVRLGSPVLAPKGLVGVVASVDPDSCRVLFNTSDRFAVGVRIAGERSRATGVVRGTGGPNLLLDHLSEGAVVAVGDRVVTSGIGQRYPKGLLVGTVIRVWRDPSYGFTRAWVAPAVRYDTLEEVVILR